MQNTGKLGVVAAIACALSLAASAVFFPPPASAVSRWSDFFRGEVAKDRWKSYTTPIQARYNAASTNFPGLDYQHATYLYISGAGTTSAAVTGSVKIYFEYQGGTFKCKWDNGYSRADESIFCQLRYTV